VQHAHLNHGYKNMIIPCGAPLQLCRFFSRHSKYLTTPHSLASYDCYPPWELQGYLYLYTCTIYIRCYPDRIASYRCHVSPSYIIFGCKLRLYFARGERGGGAADDQHTTVSSVFMRYISATHCKRIICVQLSPSVAYAIPWSPSTDINNNKYQ